MYFSRQERGKHSAKSEYDAEIEAYLASLPETVTYEEIINARAHKVKMFAREKTVQPGAQLGEQKRAGDERSNEERFARNLHYFCMLEHERRSVLLLPDELADVTRKFHTRNKYQFIQTQKSNQSRRQQIGRLSVARTSGFSTQSAKTPYVGSTFSASQTAENLRERSHEAAAQRVFDNLNEIIQFERQKTQYYDKSDDFETKSNADSGIGDNTGSLDSWRVQAETALNEDFCLGISSHNICHFSKKCHKYYNFFLLSFFTKLLSGSL